MKDRNCYGKKEKYLKGHAMAVNSEPLNRIAYQTFKGLCLTAVKPYILKTARAFTSSGLSSINCPLLIVSSVNSKSVLTETDIKNIFPLIEQVTGRIKEEKK